MATLTKSTGTAVLSGAVEKVTLPAVYGWVWIKNMSDSDIFAGLSADISEGADGVLAIPSGECGRIQTDGFSSIYLLGTGNALVAAQNYADCPFKSGAKGGEAPDLSEYAKKSDIPTELPANGGNADTLDGKHASDFASSYNYSLEKYLGGQTGDIRSLVHQLPSGGYLYNTERGNISEIIFPLQGDCLMSWFPAEFEDVNLIYGILMIRPMVNIGYTYMCSVYNSNVYTEWEVLYTDRTKPYVTGSATVAANSFVCVTNHGFTPSAVIWWEEGSSGVAVSFNDTQFTMNYISAVDRMVNYLIFR